MKEERIMILKMVQEGKITADEAVKLLESLAEIDSKADTLKHMKDKAVNMVDEAKPVVKKYAGKAGDILNNVAGAVKDGINSFSSKPGKSDFTDDIIDEVNDDFDIIEDDFEAEPGKMSKVKESVKENTRAAGQTVKEAAHNIKESARDIKDTINIAAMDIKDKAENVKDNIKENVSSEAVPEAEETEKE